MDVTLVLRGSGARTKFIGEPSYDFNKNLIIQTDKHEKKN